MLRTLLAALVLMFALPAEAAEPKIDNLKVVTDILKSGGKLTYMGEQHGLHGWLVRQGATMQFLYLAPDKKAVLFGGMVGGDGSNVTADQMTVLMAKDPEVSAFLQSTLLGQGSEAPAPKEADFAVPAVPLTTGEKLFEDMQNAAGVTMGQAGIPYLVMMVDPRCPFCKETWQELRGKVNEGKLRVRLVPIGAANSENENEAAFFLKAKDPLKTWNAWVDGDKSVLSGKAGEADLKAVRESFKLAERWQIQQVPFLVYRGGDQKVKIVQGKPSSVPGILQDLGVQ